MIAGLLDFVPRWLLAGLVAMLLATSCGLQWRLDRAKVRQAELVAQVAQAEAQAQERARELAQKVIEATNEARKRESNLRAAADAARGESDGLRGDVEALRAQLAGASRDAAAERAAAIADVLGQCARRYSDLAARADRHVNDIRTLMEAWPR